MTAQPQCEDDSPGPDYRQLLLLDQSRYPLGKIGTLPQIASVTLFGPGTSAPR